MPSPAQDAQLTAKGSELFGVQCAVCHGKEAHGIQQMNAPAIAGQEPWYLARQMRLFRKGVRGTDPAHAPGQQMAAIAQTLSSSDIEALAHYVASLPPARHPALEAGSASVGKARFQTVCGACHGNRAEGNKALNAPRLTGLDPWYLTSQMVQFTEGQRGTHPQDTFGLQMRPMAATIDSREAMDDITAYILSLQE